jgi:hypothetical protein
MTVWVILSSTGTLMAFSPVLPGCQRGMNAGIYRLRSAFSWVMMSVRDRASGVRSFQSATMSLTGVSVS